MSPLEVGERSLLHPMLQEKDRQALVEAQRVGQPECRPGIFLKRATSVLASTRDFLLVFCLFLALPCSYLPLQAGGLPDLSGTIRHGMLALPLEPLLDHVHSQVESVS